MGPHSGEVYVLAYINSNLEIAFREFTDRTQRGQLNTHAAYVHRECYKQILTLGREDRYNWKNN